MKEKHIKLKIFLLKIWEKMAAIGKGLSKSIKKKVDGKQIKSVFVSCIKVFGYGIVGVFSIAYGFFKLHIDVVNGNLIGWEIMCNLDIMFQLEMQILLTVLFCNIFAKIYLYSNNIIKGKRFYTFFPKVWAAMIGILSLAYGILAFIGMSPHPICAIVASLVNVAPFIFCIWLYPREEMVSQDKNEKKNIQIYAARYTLVIPALLVIGLNIFASTGMYSFYNALVRHDYSKIVLHSITRLLFLAFSTMLLPKNKKNLTKYCIVFSIVLSLAGIAGLFLLKRDGMKEYSQVLLNLFLAVMTSIFMSIFESWYLYVTMYATAHLKKDEKKQTDEKDEKKQTDEKDEKDKLTKRMEKKQTYDWQTLCKARKSIVETANYIVSLLPAVVFLLFPFQIFNYIYIMTVGIGLAVINIVWFNIILPDFDSISGKREIKKKGISIGRGIAGMTTLIFLIMDHIYESNLLTGIRSFIEKDFLTMFDRFENYSIIIIEIFLTTFLFAVLKAAITNYTKIREIYGVSTRIPILIRLTSYIFACFIILLTYSLLSGDVRNRMNVSSFMLFLFIISDLIWGLYKFCKHEERVEKHEKIHRRKEPVNAKIWRGNDIE